MPNIYYDTPRSEELVGVRNAVTLLYSSPIKQRVAFMSRLAVTLLVRHNGSENFTDASFLLPWC